MKTESLMKQRIYFIIEYSSLIVYRTLRILSTQTTHTMQNHAGIIICSIVLGVSSKILNSLIIPDTTYASEFEID